MVHASWGNMVESFLLAVRLTVNFVCNCQRSAGRCMRMNYWFSLAFWLEQVCDLFPSNSFHLCGNKYKHQSNLSFWVNTFHDKLYLWDNEPFPYNQRMKSYSWTDFSSHQNLEIAIFIKKKRFVEGEHGLWKVLNTMSYGLGNQKPSCGN